MQKYIIYEPVKWDWIAEGANNIETFKCAHNAESVIFQRCAWKNVWSKLPFYPIESIGLVTCRREATFFLYSTGLDSANWKIYRISDSRDDRFVSRNELIAPLLALRQSFASVQRKSWRSGRLFDVRNFSDPIPIIIPYQARRAYFNAQLY